MALRLDSWAHQFIVFAILFALTLAGRPASAALSRHRIIEHKAHAIRHAAHAHRTGTRMAGNRGRYAAHSTRHQHAAKPTHIALRDKPLIVIDPGHGGLDSGAIGRSGTLEKYVTLTEAKDLQQVLLASHRYRVALTRDSDSYVSLSRRLARTNAGDVALFISLHADASPDRSARGATVYIRSGAGAGPQLRKLEADQASPSAIGHAIADGGEKINAEPGSGLLQYTMVDNLNDDIRMTGDPDRSARFFVLANRDIPSVLIEMGFLSNRQDEALLKNPRHLHRIALAIRDAIDDYFADLRRARVPNT